MTDAEMRRIEEELGFGLPLFYKSTMRDYPFADEAGREPMLPDDPEEVINLNGGGLEMDGIECVFFVGSGGDETFYFVDAAEPASAVYKSAGETGHHQVQAGSWGRYLTQVRLSRKQRWRGIAKVGPSNRWWPF